MVYLVAALWLGKNDPKDDEKKAPITVNITISFTCFILRKVLPIGAKFIRNVRFFNEFHDQLAK